MTRSLTRRFLTARSPTARPLLALACAVFLLLPWPAPVSVAGALVGVGAVAAGWTVLRPGSLGPTLVLGLGAMAWVRDVPVPAGVDGWLYAVAFGAAGYAVHALAALAAAVPPGIRLDRHTWAGQIGHGVTALAVALIALALAGSVPNGLGDAAPASSPLIGGALLLAAIAAGIPRAIGRWSRT